MSEPRDPTVTESEGVSSAASPSAAPQSSALQNDLRTFLIADIRGYTTYTRERGDEASAELVRRFSEIVQEVVTARDGFLLELRGDEALVVFVSARKALRAAIELQDRFVAEQLPLGVGIGLDAGEAIPVGGGYRGSALNLAARLCASASGGETLASETVIHLAAKIDGISYVDARDLKVKGFDSSIRAVAVIHSERAKGHRPAEGRKSAGRPTALALAAIAVAAVSGVTLGGFLLNQGGTSAPTTNPSRPGLSTVSSGVESEAPTSSTLAAATQDPLALANLPLLAFYDGSSGELKGTTKLAGPRNISFFAGGSLWILANNQRALEFDRVDPDSHAITQRITVPLNEPNGFTYDDDYIWVTDLSGPRVVRIDQRSGFAQTYDFASDPSDTASASDVTAGAGSVWLARQDIGQIVRMDAQSGEIQKRISVDAWGMAYGGDAVWYWANGSIGRIDPVTDVQTFQHPITLSSQSGLGNIYFAGDDAWTSSPDTGAVYRVDRSGRVTTYSLEPGVGEMAAAGDAMWVTNANTGTLTGIEIATGLIDRTIDTGHATLSVAAGNDELMVAVGPTPDEGIASLPGSVLTIATDGQPFYNPGPDPPVNGDYQVRQALYLTCANLLIHPDASGPDGLGLVPEAAAAMPTVSADGLTYTFTIRPGFKFSPPSDEEVTAETFRYSLERAVSPVYQDGDLGPSLLGDIAGVHEYRAGTAPTVTGLKADGDKLMITLNSPAPDILSRLASSVACPVPTKGTPPLRSGLGVDWPVSGSGPYYISQTIRKRLVVLSKNPNYGGQRPQPFDEIAFRLEVAPDTALQMVNDGRADAVMFNSGDPLSGPQSDLAAKWGPGGSSTATGGQHWFGAPDTSVNFLALNPTRQPFSDPRLRQAVALALDPVEISKIWVAEPTSDLLVPSVEGSDPNAAVSTPNIEAAKALVDGRQVKVTMLAAPQEGNCGPCTDFQNAVTRQLAAIGITVSLSYPPGTDYPGDGVFDTGSDIDLLNWGSGSYFSDPVGLLQGLHDVSWIGKANLDELTRLESAGEQDRIDGSVALAHQLVDTQFLVVPTGYSVYPFFTSERIGCGFVQPAVSGVDLLSLCVKDGSTASPAPSPSP